MSKLIKLGRLARETKVNLRGNKWDSGALFCQGIGTKNRCKFVEGGGATHSACATTATCT